MHVHVAESEDCSSLVSWFDSQQCDSRNIVCFGDPQACGKNIFKFFYFSACNLQLLIGANTQW